MYKNSLRGYAGNSSSYNYHLETDIIILIADYSVNPSSRLISYIDN